MSGVYSWFPWRRGGSIFFISPAPSDILNLLRRSPPPRTTPTMNTPRCLSPLIALLLLAAPARAEDAARPVDVRARHPAGPDAGRVQRRGLPRQGPRAERLRPVAARLRPDFDFHAIVSRGARPARVFRPPPNRACCCARRRRGRRTAAARGSRPGSAGYELVRRWIARGHAAHPGGRPGAVAHHRRAGRPRARHQRRAATGRHRPLLRRRDRAT